MKKLLIIIFLFAPLALFSQEVQERLFLRTFEAKEGITTQFAENFSDKLLLYFFEEGKGKYRVLNESDIKIMYQKAEELLKLGCNAEECLTQIAYAIDADIIIYGKLEKTSEGEINVLAQSLIRNKKTDELSKHSIVQISFYESQSDWFAKEIVKKLINPKYFIDKSKAPAEIKVQLSIKELKLPQLKGLDLKVFEFKTTDETIANIINFSKDIIREGDNLFNNKEYSSAIEKYEDVIQRIETKLPETKQAKLTSFKNSVIERTVSSYAMLFKSKIEEIDEKLKTSEDYESAISDYDNLLNEIDKLREEYKNRLKEIVNSLKQRKDAVGILLAQKEEKEGDLYYSEYKFDNAIKKYENALDLTENLYFKTENINYIKKLENKKKISIDTSYSYLKNRISSYCDWIDYYNFKGESKKAKETLEKAREEIKKSRWKDKKIIGMFNERAEILKAEKIIFFWEKTYGEWGDDVANSIQQTRDGGYIVAGWTSSKGAGGEDFRVLKLDEYGEIIWEKTYGGYKADFAYSIQQTKDGSYIVAGSTESKGAGKEDFWVLKLDEYGEIIWEKTYGGSKNDWANSIQQTRDGGYIVAGVTYSKGAGRLDFWVLKLNEKGEIIWEKTYGGSENDCANSIQQTREGGYIVAGYTESKGTGERDSWVLKLDEYGEIIWEKTYGGEYNDEANSIQQTRDGGYIVAGSTESKGVGKEDFWVLKLDKNGEIIWDKTYGGDSFDESYSIQQTRDGGYIVAGWTSSKGAGGWDSCVLKLDEEGEIIWEKTYGGEYNDELHSIQQTRDGGYIVAGWTSSKGAGGRDFWVLKLNEKGEIEK